MSEEKVGGSLLKERIAEHIAKNIQNGIYVPGEKINEETIASQFFVSRTPVREVLAMLCSNGFIDKVPNKGYYVRELDRHTMNETYELIGILDFCCAKKALPYLEKEDFLKMEEYIAKMDLAIKFENFPDYVDNQAAFHQQYILKCHNSVLIKTIENLLRSPMPVTYTPKQYHVFLRAWTGYQIKVGRDHIHNLFKLRICNIYLAF